MGQMKHIDFYPIDYIDRIEKKSKGKDKEDENPDKINEFTKELIKAIKEKDIKMIYFGEIK